ncbi:MAG: T9SS type A sorting domain-containing protein [Actinobacteria bacterium]|nr:T9SS type A sorting domain-containing protein [Actinomycetota bacterium]
MNIAGVPFPYDAARMPDLPNSLKGTWIESIYNNYPENGTDAWVQSQIDIAVNFMKSRNVPLWCGEFGAHIPNSTTQDRARWLQTVRSYFEANGIAWSMWEFAGSFGIYKPGSRGLFDYDVNIPIIEALGLTPPPQKEFILTPDTTGFKMYDDFIAPGFRESSWISNGTLSFYSQDRPLSGHYCIHWADADRYNNIGFQFAPVKDMSELVAQGFAIDLWVRCAQPSVNIDIRFLDTKTDVPEDHPWRMRYTIDNTVAAWNGEWQHLQIPLKKFTEQGSWDNNQWYNPWGDFDWTQIDQFQIVAEHSNLHGIDLYFDNIRIVDPKIVRVERKVPVPSCSDLLQNYPNPFNPTTRIQYNLAQPGKVDLAIFDVSGKQLNQLVSAMQAAGRHGVEWNGKNNLGQAVTSGVYFYRLIVRGNGSRFSETKKMILIK